MGFRRGRYLAERHPAGRRRRRGIDCRQYCAGVFLSTLPDLGGRAFDVRGLVIAHLQLTAIGRGPVTEGLIQQLVHQAQQLGADAVVDIKTMVGGDNGHCVITGTAVKIR